MTTAIMLVVLLALLAIMLVLISHVWKVSIHRKQKKLKKRVL